MAMPGDAYLADGAPTRVAMTRAITLASPPEDVWPWLAQLGRGAGFYSFDRLDNGGKASARHIVSWIPEPALGDATSIGYLRRIEPGMGLTWWVPGAPFLGASTRMVVDMHLRPLGTGSRVVVRISGDARGATAAPLMVLFRAIDSIMACRQLLGIRDRVESSATPGPHQETGARDQYQLHEVVYAGGGGAGVPGKEMGAEFHLTAIQAGVVSANPP